MLFNKDFFAVCELFFYFVVVITIPKVMRVFVKYLMESVEHLFVQSKSQKEEFEALNEKLKECERMMFDKRRDLENLRKDARALRGDFDKALEAARKEFAF